MDVSALDQLTRDELAALRGAAAWYAKYRSASVADRAADGSAAAVVEREQYLDLLSALDKLGVRVRVPDGLVELTSAA